MSGTPRPTGIGAFCWNQLESTDLERAGTFFREMVGWELQREVRGTWDVDLARRPGESDPLASLRSLSPGPGVRSAWLSFVHVADPAGTCARAEALGGRIRMAPTVIPGAGTFAVLADPWGAALGLCRPEDGEAVHNGVGAFHWYELVTRETRAVQAFYGPLLGWRFEVGIPALGPYTLIFRGAEQVGGLWEPDGPGWEAVPSQWLPYLQVRAVAPLVPRAGALGGEVHVPPTDVPDVGRFMVVADPGGAICALVERKGSR